MSNLFGKIVLATGSALVAGGLLVIAYLAAGAFLLAGILSAVFLVGERTEVVQYVFAPIAFSALLMAGLDGIRNKIDPGPSSDKDLYDLPPEEDALVPTVCASLEEALTALKADHEFLLRGGVFSKDWIDSYITFKEEDVRRIRMAPHPLEFEMYYSL